MAYRLLKYSNKLTVVILLLCLGFVFWWTCPSIIKGTNEINIIKHFDLDEGNVVAFYEKFYKGYFVCPPDIVSYPTAFYYLAGTYLFPYSWLHPNEDNSQTVIITFRALNTLSIVLTLVLIYFLALYFIESRVFTCLLLVFVVCSSQFLCWGVNSRPHPFENFLLFASIFLGLLWIDKKKYQYFLGCLLTAALAFSTKYSGMFMLVPLFIFLIHDFYMMDISKLAQIIYKKYRLIMYSGFSVICFGLSMVIFLYLCLLPYVVENTRTGSIFGLKGLMNMGIYKICIFSLILLIVAGCLWIWLNFYSRRILNLHKNNDFALPLNKYEHMTLLSNLGLLVIFSFAVIFSAVFLLANPHYMIDPFASFRAFFGLGLIEFSFSHEGRGFLREFLNNFAWFMLIFDRILLGASAGVALIWYFIFEVLSWKRNWQLDRGRLKQRLFIWLYIFANLIFLLFFIKFRAHHYLIVISFLLLFLIIYAVNKSVQLVHKKIIKVLLVILFFILLCWNLAERAPVLLRAYELKISKDSDTCLFIGNWLVSQYDANTKIWKDSQEFYIPPKFKNVSFMYLSDTIDNNFDMIEELNPDILVITNAYDPHLKNMQKIEKAMKDGRLQEFKLQKKFDYEGPLAKSGWYKKIFIYSK